MTPEQLSKYHDKYDSETVSFTGLCHDCGKNVTVSSTEEYSDDEKLHCSGYKIDGGAIYLADECNGTIRHKCRDCYSKDPVLRLFQETEIYTRIVGYMRPISQWGEAKVNEFHDRKTFDRTFKLPEDAA